ncbi:type VII secretion target [Saccharothrix sp. NRRL B-16314]|uniref:type VII secretion target n=1 Tax=Saccharothrix sp. NRRL B-16314 TaxID=1463825 RepID=UPI000525D0FE|nr:type VII secretion target [Saccharothrix sp. NRRL B-16314]
MAGFKADTGRMRESANGFQRAGDHAGTAASSLGGTAVPPGAFGVSAPARGLAADLDAIVGRRRDGIARRRDRLTEIAELVRRDADEYDRADADGTEEIDRSGGGLR